MPLDDPQLLLSLKRTLSALALPPTGPLLLALLGLMLLKNRQRSGRMLLWAGVLSGLIFSQPALVYPLTGVLENTPPPAITEVRQAQAIVILGAGKRSRAPEFGGSTISALSLERLRYGVWLARQTGLPILASGGTPGDPQPEADLMQKIAREEFGVPIRWVESASTSTYENARFSAALLSGAGIRRILLVTHAVHMPRAQAEFAATGLQVIPAPTGWLSPREENRIGVADSRTLLAAWLGVREWFALGTRFLLASEHP